MKERVREIAAELIAIAAARADAYVEEVSTLAHQLRELHDPAALFVLVAPETRAKHVAFEVNRRKAVEAGQLRQVAKSKAGDSPFRKRIEVEAVK